MAEGPDQKRRLTLHTLFPSVHIISPVWGASEPFNMYVVGMVAH